MRAPIGFDIETQQFDAAVRGDHVPLDPLEVLQANTAGVTVNSVAGTAITSTRNSATKITRDAGVWISRVIIPISAIVAAGAYTNFVVGETITETGSSKTGVVESVTASLLILKTIDGEFTGAATLTGTTSSVTATGGVANNVLEDLKGQWIYAYVNPTVATGTWSRITSNVKDYLNTDVNDILGSADRIIICKDKDTARKAMDIDYGA